MEFSHSEDKTKLLTLRREDKKSAVDCSQDALTDVKLAVSQAQNKSVALVSVFVS